MPSLEPSKAVKKRILKGNWQGSFETPTAEENTAAPREGNVADLTVPAGEKPILAQLQSFAKVRNLVDYVEKPVVVGAGVERWGLVSARQSRAAPPHVAKIDVGRGMSFASFRRFWAVAANRNSSLAPLGPRRRSLPSPRMRFR